MSCGNKSSRIDIKESKNEGPCIQEKEPLEVLCWEDESTMLGCSHPWSTGNIIHWTVLHCPLGSTAAVPSHQCWLLSLPPPPPVLCNLHIVHTNSFLYVSPPCLWDCERLIFFSWSQGLTGRSPARLIWFPLILFVCFYVGVIQNDRTYILPQENSSVSESLWEEPQEAFEWWQ